MNEHGGKALSEEHETIGVIGAGTMGSGIALAALYQGFPVILQDIDPAMLQGAQSYLEKFLARKGLQSNLGRLTPAQDLDALAGAEVVIEAAPEDLALKRDLFARLDALCPPPAILATNTSTLSVSAIAAATGTPERVAGMHFFNPAPVLPLVEVVRGEASSPETLARLVSLAERFGKTPVVTRDTPGFIVNRVARPFYGEALRLLGEGVAGVETIDQVVQLGGGFRMGPFRLMDLIGVDINFASMKSMYEQTFGEPRYRPHWIQARMVSEGRLGRKTGQGFYAYPEDEPADAPVVSTADEIQSGSVWISTGTWAPGLADLCKTSGHTLFEEPPGESPPLVGIVAAGRGESLQAILREFERSLPAPVPLMCQAVDISISEVIPWLAHPERVVGFDGLFAGSGEAITLVASPLLDDPIRIRVETFCRSIGRLPVWIEDSPALILPRLVCTLANEAAFAVMERVADPETIDLAMRLGVNYPLGPVEWARRLGIGRVLAVLEHLRTEFGEERYRAAYLLRRWARQEGASASPE